MWAGGSQLGEQQAQQAATVFVFAGVIAVSPRACVSLCPVPSILHNCTTRAVVVRECTRYREAKEPQVFDCLH